MKYVCGLWLMLLVCAGAPADAVTLYVNNTGTPACSDATTKASNSAAAPWCSVYRAAHGSTSGDVGAQAAAAGDTVLVTAGTYDQAGAHSRLTPSLNPANSGTSGNYIVIQCASGTCNLTQSSDYGPVMGCNTRNYIKWIGFTVDERNVTVTPDTGPVVGWDSTACWFESNTIIGYQYGHNLGDNHPGIRLEVCPGCTARLNVIHDFYTCPDFASCTSTTPVNVNNGACIQTYGSSSLLIESNTLYNCGAGIFFKGGPNGGRTGTSPGHTVRYNLIHDTLDSGIVSFTDAPSTVTNPTLIYQNIVYNAGTQCARFWISNSQFGDPTYNYLVNNTFYNCGTAGVNFNGSADPGWGSLHLVVWNNIISVSTNGVQSTMSASFHQNTAQADFEHNIYHSLGGTNFVLAGGGTNIALGTWQAGPYTQDASAPAGATSNPLFVTAGSDFHLQGGSPYLAQGVDMLDLDGDTLTNDTIPAGAYITGSEQIGASGGGAPAGPTLLRFRFHL